MIKCQLFEINLTYIPRLYSTLVLLLLQIKNSKKKKKNYSYGLLGYNKWKNNNSEPMFELLVNKLIIWTLRDPRKASEVHLLTILSFSFLISNAFCFRSFWDCLLLFAAIVVDFGLIPSWIVFYCADFGELMIFVVFQRLYNIQSTFQKRKNANFGRILFLDKEIIND